MKEHLGASSFKDVGKFYDEHYQKDGAESFTENRDSIIHLLKMFSHPPELKKGGKLLDAGCGNGQFIETVYEKLNCVGIEVSDMAYQIAKKKLEGKSHILKMDIESIAFESNDWFGTFDYVTSLGVLEHTMNPKRCKDILMNCLKVGGLMVITVPLEFSDPFYNLRQEANQKTNERFATLNEWLDYFGRDEEAFEVIGEGESKHVAIIYQKEE